MKRLIIIINILNNKDYINNIVMFYTYSYRLQEK